MKGLDELKAEIKEEASENPEKFFATDVLREKGFSRGQCEKCGLYLWAKDENREICGEPECGDGYTFINDSPTDEEFSYIEAWEKFEEFMENRSYKSIDRYPVVARWRDDVEFTGASIYCFQPYVVSGEAEPPADELVIPQPSLRFNDVDNVGITGRHYTNFTMIGQTCFQPPEKYEQDRYFRDMFEFTVEGLGIPEEKLILHEDSWGGGGNLGACMEFFVDGLELFNQVYMFYRQTPDGYEELDLKVLDMGMGQERITWISRGTETSYESVMPETLKKMKEKTGLKVDQEIWEKFLPHSSELNIDEVEDIDDKWREVAEKIDKDVDDLKDAIKPAAALYSIAEHTRALIYALADGKIPSNTGGGHNLRMIYRRAKDFIEKYDWDIDMEEVARWNAEELEPMFPELLASMDEIEEILEVEAEKYERARRKAEEKLESLDEQPSLDEMIELYESHGVSPEMMEEHGFEVPEDFYTQLGEDEEAVHEAEAEFDLEDVEETEKIYYERRAPYSDDGEASDFSFEASVEKIIDEEWIVLDRTMFYPQGGGQAYDKGVIDGFEVDEVIKQAGVVLHHAAEHGLEEEASVKCLVDGERRKQLTQHHSVTHMVNSAAREEFGEHIYQAGANKTVEKARLDITHYEKPSRKDLDEIEASVKKIIEDDHRIDVLEMAKSDAEQKYGFRIYQGGAPPGNTIRLIDIDSVDIEACGGTHLEKTSHAEEFVITGCKRIQDGVVRLEYKAGESAREYMEELEDVFNDSAETIFDEGHNLKALKQQTVRDKRKTLRELSDKLSVEIEDIPKTLERFQNEISSYKSRADKLQEFLNAEDIPRDRMEVDGRDVVGRVNKLFEDRKQLEKEVEARESSIEAFLDNEIEESGVKDIEADVPTENVGLLIQVAQKLSRKHEARITLVGDKGAVSASQTDKSAREKLEAYSDNVQGDKEFAKAFDI